MSRAPIHVLVSKREQWDVDDQEPHECDCGQPARSRVVFWQGQIRVGTGWTCARHTPSASTVRDLIT